MNNDQENNSSGGYDYREQTGSGYQQPPQYGSGSYTSLPGVQYPYSSPGYSGATSGGYYPQSYGYGTGAGTPGYSGYAGYPGYTPAPTTPPTQGSAAGGVPAGYGYQMTPPASGAGSPGMPSQAAPSPTGVEVPGLLPSEQSYIENILRLNLHKNVTVYMTFENNPEWPAKVFSGELQAAGKDHIIISDDSTGKRYLLLMIYLNYVTFEGPINYSYPYTGAEG